MSETDIQLLMQLGVAFLAGAAIGILLGAIFRLRRTGQLQQALHNASIRDRDNRQGQRG